MTGFDPQTIGFGGNHSTNWTTSTAHEAKISGKNGRILSNLRLQWAGKPVQSAIGRHVLDIDPTSLKFEEIYTFLDSRSDARNSHNYNISHALSRI